MTQPSTQLPPPSLPPLWYDPAPAHFDMLLPAWFKLLVLGILTTLVILYIDQPLARWAAAHPTENYSQSLTPGGDFYRELMWLEQFGQGVSTVSAVLAVYLIDTRYGRRRALAIALGCIFTVLLTHLLKDMIGRSRPYVAAQDGSWIWGGPMMGFTNKSAWGSFPSAHTTSAFALAAGLAWFYPRGRPLFMGLALITASLRVLHNAHYLSDTLAGMGIGVFVMRSMLALKVPGRLIALGPPWGQRWWHHERQKKLMPRE